MNKARVGIVGGTGYTGAELMRLLAAHPRVELVCITSRKLAGQRVTDSFPSLRGHVDLVFEAPDAGQLSRCDVVFFATPHGTAMQEAPALLDAGIKVVDLSADFRLRDADVFAQWYGMTHTATGWLERAAYGLPETHREDIRAAALTANPGCYPTAVQLGLAPLLKACVVDLESLVADVKSGVTGAGREAKTGSLFCENNDSFRAYGVAGHRHGPEVNQELSWLAGAEVDCVFTPHLLPIQRGILATLHLRVRAAGDIQAMYEAHYADEPFVDVLPAGQSPETRNVRGTNRCQIGIVPIAGERVVVLSVIDNLVKGASGQAVQNMNLMMGFEEGTALMQPGLWP
ncbi:N-acetyl-gamma-glutamyl-phosphate reductase [Algiphilus sp.]|uniref:N-acetyl-gamma-glutamyl-phosphate reductase n=1 Tax=Algiphilus sp. TaxID=1872431 RepID=UPI002A65C728|nr:N-acetyl-gamma-glutamyl-phosphate reductase [Pseudomonadota bacterium]